MNISGLNDLQVQPYRVGIRQVLAIRRNHASGHVVLGRIRCELPQSQLGHRQNGLPPNEPETRDRNRNEYRNDASTSGPPESAPRLNSGFQLLQFCAEFRCALMSRLTLLFQQLEYDPFELRWQIWIQLSWRDWNLIQQCMLKLWS